MKNSAIKNELKRQKKYEAKMLNWEKEISISSVENDLLTKAKDDIFDFASEIMELQYGNSIITVNKKIIKKGLSSALIAARILTKRPPLVKKVKV